MGEGSRFQGETAAESVSSKMVAGPQEGKHGNAGACEDAGEGHQDGGDAEGARGVEEEGEGGVRKARQEEDPHLEQGGHPKPTCQQSAGAVSKQEAEGRGEDSWHFSKGYTGSIKAVEGFIHNEYGQIAHLTHIF